MTDAADDFDALFEEVSAQRASAPAPAPAPAPAAAAEDDLESLFDEISSARPAEAAPAAPVAAAAPAAAADGEETAHDGTMYERLGGIVRLLHDSLRELGYDKALTEASSQITDAQDRLEYVATLTEQAANKVLNTLDDGMPAQDVLSKQAKDMEDRWADLFAGKLSHRGVQGAGRRLARLRAGRVGSDRSREGAPARDHDGPGLPGHHRPADQEVVVKITQTVENELAQLLRDSAPPRSRKSWREALRSKERSAADVGSVRAVRGAGPG
jgi:chemotaxis protein CheZ